MRMLEPLPQCGMQPSMKALPSSTFLRTGPNSSESQSRHEEARGFHRERPFVLAPPVVVDAVYHVLACVDCEAGNNGADRQRPSLLNFEMPWLLVFHFAELDIMEPSIMEGEGAVKIRLGPSLSHSPSSGQRVPWRGDAPRKLPRLSMALPDKGQGVPQNYRCSRLT